MKNILDLKDEELDIEVNVVDELMGRGKTSAAINYINDSGDDVRFLYITPYLTEVNRIIDSCKDKKFKQPDDSHGSKTRSIKYLFDKKENIVSTHSLFRNFDKEIIDLAYANNYILIMDEVADVIEQFQITYDDMKSILKDYAHVDEETGLLIWDYKEYQGEFERVKKLCDLKCIAIYNDVAMLWLFPISTFKAFRKIFILTYLFKAQTQCYYYDYYGVKYKNMYVEQKDGKYQFTEDPVDYSNQYDFNSLINLYENKKLNLIGDDKYALSAGWYDRNQNNSLIKQLKNNTTNYFRNVLNSPSNNNIWTTFAEYKTNISGKGYSKGFVPLNMRATNDYKDRQAVAYLVNRFFNPYIKQFFTSHGVTVDEDGFALSEMLQFIWRSAIRQGKEINVYMPSARMRAILKEWIYKQSNMIKENKND